MNTISKALAGTVAAGAMAMTAAAPASAQDYYYHRDRDGISAGEVIAGVAILGGIAAIAASANGANRYDTRYYRDGQYGYYNGSPRDAVAQCVNAVRMDAQRYGYRYANVTQIRDVDDTHDGWKVKGRIEVGGGNGYYGRQGYYDRGYYGNGYNNGYYNNGYYNRADIGSFTCRTDRGRIADIDYSGIRGM